MCVAQIPVPMFATDKCALFTLRLTRYTHNFIKNSHRQTGTTGQKNYGKKECKELGTEKNVDNHIVKFLTPAACCGFVALPFLSAASGYQAK